MMEYLLSGYNYRFIDGVISDTTKPTSIMTDTSLNYTAFGNLTDPPQIPSMNDDAEGGLKGGLPFWFIPTIIAGTMATMLLFACLVVYCSEMIPFMRKEPVRPHRTYDKYAFHLQD